MLEVWQLLSLLPYTRRYLLYSRTRPAYTSHLLLQAAKKRTDKLARRLLKRVAVPESDEERRVVFLPRARNFAKLAHSNPEPAVAVMVNSVSRRLLTATPIYCTSWIFYQAG